MKTVKAMVRKHECVLPQIVRRMYEQETNLIHSHPMETGKTVLKGKHSSGPILSTGVGKPFKEIHFKSMIIKCNDANSCVILQKYWPISAIKCKAVCIPYTSKKDFAIFPLMRFEN